MKATPLVVWAIATTIAVEPIAAVTSFRYEGLCEASAAAHVDSMHFVVASDDSELLQIYRRGVPKPSGSFTQSGVTDIEGAARIGETIFWLTSHSLNKDGEDKPKRKVMFATRVSGSGLVAVGTPYMDLRPRVASALRIDEKSLNIEGLAATPEGDLIVGLRAPLTNDNKARLVRIENPLALLGLSGKPADATVHELPPLNLGGGGIRSIERVGTGDRAYLIVAGPSGAEPASSTLRWWDGTAKVGTEHEVSLNGATPEAVLMLGAGSIGVLGDNESQCSDKDDFTGARWFPALEIDEIGSERISVRWEAK